MSVPSPDVRVLVIDRDARVRAALRQLLAGEPGLEVCREAADAAGALGQLAARLPDAVLVDPLLLTAAAGAPVLSAVAGAGMRVVVLTADRSLRASARRLGICAVLDKDGDHDRLLAALTPAGNHGRMPPPEGRAVQRVVRVPSPAGGALPGPACPATSLRRSPPAVCRTRRPAERQETRGPCTDAHRGRRCEAGTWQPGPGGPAHDRRRSGGVAKERSQ
jgi:ActR/RegA family two-component response regulator